MREYITTPQISYFKVGFLTIHFYALFIIVGIFAAISLAKRRSPENSELINDLALYVIPSGVIGARAYHVLTAPQKYFNRHYLDAVKVWQGGLGIWGAIGGGFAATYLILRKRGKLAQLLDLADAVAPGLLIAQAIGRIGNWFNGELFGKPTNLPWKLLIPLENRPPGFERYEFFQPTFLYEALWCLSVAFFLMKYRSRSPGETFWLYVCLYSFGRLFIEMIRIDFANLILGIRLNVWVALFFTLLGLQRFLAKRLQKIE